MECGSRFSKGSQVSSVVSHTTLKKGTLFSKVMAENSADVVLSRWFSCGSEIQRRWWRQTATRLFPVFLHYTLCDEADVWLFELRPVLKWDPQRWGTDRPGEIRRCPRMYSLSWGLFERTKCARTCYYCCKAISGTLWNATSKANSPKGGV